MAEKIVMTSSNAETSALFGAFDSNIKLVENAFDVKIYNRNTETDDGDAIVVSGEREGVACAVKALEYLKHMTGATDTIESQSVEYVIGLVKDGSEELAEGFSSDAICITNRGKPIKAKTVGQKKYVKTIRDNTVVLGLGPAGTGKTFLAVAMAVKALKEKQVSRILLTRPAIEAGERLGFLPGDLLSKIDPYLRPLYDALGEMLGPETHQKLVEKGVIEVAPLAYMRGRTLDDAFIILDEAQNATPEQVKMFLTRLGFGSKVVVTGDLTQTDLPYGQRSGLASAIKILAGIDDIAIHYLSEKDVVRHHLVQKIILAYDAYDREQAAKKQQAESREPHRPASDRRQAERRDPGARTYRPKQND